MTSGCSTCAAGVAYAPVVQALRLLRRRSIRRTCAGWSVYGTPRVYVEGEPVRNTLRALTW